MNQKIEEDQESDVQQEKGKTCIIHIGKPGLLRRPTIFHGPAPYGAMDILMNPPFPNKIIKSPRNNGLESLCDDEQPE